MKPTFPFLIVVALAIFASVCFADSNLRHSLNPPADDVPKVAAIHGRTVRVNVPPGFRDVTLQRKTSQRENPWVTISTIAVDGNKGVVEFTLRSRLTRPFLRAVGRRASVPAPEPDVTPVLPDPPTPPPDVVLPALDKVTFSRRTDRAWIADEHLVQFARTGRYESNAVLSVSSLANPEVTLSTLDIGERVLAIELQGSLLYVVQYSLFPRKVTVDESTGLDTFTWNSGGALKLSVYSVASLPQIVKLGETSVIVDDYAGGHLKLLFPTNGSVVVAQLIDPEANISYVIAPAGGYRTDNWLRLHVFDVTNPRSPLGLAVTTIGRNKQLAFGETFAADGKIFVGQQHSPWPEREPQVIVVPFGSPAPLPAPKVNNGDFLRVIDFSDPAAPAVGEPVSLPGSLREVSPDGTLLYTVGPGYDPKGNPDYSRKFIHAAAYDGLVQLVDSIEVGTLLMGDFQIAKGNLFLSRTHLDSAKRPVGTTFEAWTLGTNRKFILRDTLSMPHSGQFSILGDAAIVRRSGVFGGTFTVINIAVPSDLRFVGDVRFFPLAKPANFVGDLTRGFWISEDVYGLHYVAPPK